MKLTETRVYTPKSDLRNPLALLTGMFRDLLDSRGLAWRLFVRDTSAQYRQSLLGYAWAFIPLIVVCVPFIFLNSQGIVTVGETDIPYPAYCVIGMTIWQVFVDSLNSPLKTMIASKAMLARINFPREAIILSGVGQVVFSFLVRMVVLMVVLVWYKISLPATALLFPVGILALILVGLTLGLLLTPFGLLYSDVQHTLPIASMFLLFFTPVIYPPPTSGLGATISSWNPLAPLVSITRDWLTVGEAGMGGGFWIIIAVSAALLLSSWVLYRIALPHIVARLGN